MNRSRLRITFSIRLLVLRHHQKFTRVRKPILYGSLVGTRDDQSRQGSAAENIVAGPGYYSFEVEIQSSRPENPRKNFAKDDHKARLPECAGSKNAAAVEKRPYAGTRTFENGTMISLFNKNV